MGRQLTLWLTLFFFCSKITADGDCSHEIKRCLLLGRKVMTNLDSILSSRDIYFANKGPSSQGYGFSSGHVWMWELDCEEGWALKNWCFWTVVLEKALESPLDTRRSNQSILKEISPEYSENEDHGIRSHHFMGNRWGNSRNSVRLFGGAPKSLQMVTAAMKLKDTYSLEEKLWPT